MPNTQITVKCPLPGLEAVAVTYNLMASSKQVGVWQKTLGAENGDVVVVKVDGWPVEYGEPFGDDAPSAFRLWAIQQGLGTATREFLTDPN
jgi:hypothetical protein